MLVLDLCVLVLMRVSEVVAVKHFVVVMPTEKFASVPKPTVTKDCSWLLLLWILWL